MNGATIAELWTPGLTVPVTKQTPDPRVAVGSGGPDPNFGSGGFGAGVDQWYCVLANGWCFGRASAIWGAGGSAGGPGDGVYWHELPLPMKPPSANRLGDAAVGQVYISKAGLLCPAPLVAFCIPSQNPGGTTADGRPATATSWAKFSLMTGGNSGTATVANGTSSIVVNHNLGLTPTQPDIVPLSSPAVAGCDLSHVWVDTITATQFTIHAQTAAGGNLTAALQFAWSAFWPAGTVGPAIPGAWGSLLDHYEFDFLYPIGP